MHSYALFLVVDDYMYAASEGATPSEFKLFLSYLFRFIYILKSRLGRRNL